MKRYKQDIDLIEARGKQQLERKTLVPPIPKPKVETEVESNSYDIEAVGVRTGFQTIALHDKIPPAAEVSYYLHSVYVLMNLRRILNC